MTALEVYEHEVKANKRLTCKQLTSLFPKIWNFLLMLFSVYFFEYCIITGFA